VLGVGRREEEREQRVHGTVDGAKQRRVRARASVRRCRLRVRVRAQQRPQPASRLPRLARRRRRQVGQVTARVLQHRRRTLRIADALLDLWACSLWSSRAGRVGASVLTPLECKLSWGNSPTVLTPLECKLSWGNSPTVLTPLECKLSWGNSPTVLTSLECKLSWGNCPTVLTSLECDCELMGAHVCPAEADGRVERTKNCCAGCSSAASAACSERSGSLPCE
jgi:hypothetical protein